MTTIRAAIVAAQVGFPLMWKDDRGGHRDGDMGMEGCYPDSVLDLTDPQTALGVALRLDVWEQARDPDWPVGSLDWVGGTLLGIQRPELSWGADLRGNMVARITEIGLDARIRRALGEDPRPGTLADIGLMQPHEQWWRYDAREHGGAFIEWDRAGVFIGSSGIPGGAPNVPALASITGPAEARAAIDATLQTR